MTINFSSSHFDLSRSKRVLLAVIVATVAVLVTVLVVFQPPADLGSSSPAWLDDASGTQSPIEQVPGLVGDRTTGGGEYLSHFNSPIANDEGAQTLAALVR